MINNEAIVAIDLCEDSTLADARNVILLESNNFPNLGIEYYFSHNDAPFSPRKEHLHTVRELAGSESRLELIPKKMEKETTKKETTKKEDEQQQEQEEKHANNNNLQNNDHDKDTSRDNNVINSSNNNNNTITNHQDDETKGETVTTSNIIVNVPSVVNISINHSNELEFSKRISSSLNA